MASLAWPQTVAEEQRGAQSAGIGQQHHADRQAELRASSRRAGTARAPTRRPPAPAPTSRNPVPPTSGARRGMPPAAACPSAHSGAEQPPHREQRRSRDEGHRQDSGADAQYAEVALRGHVEDLVDPEMAVDAIAQQAEIEGQRGQQRRGTSRSRDLQGSRMCCAASKSARWMATSSIWSDGRQGLVRGRMARRRRGVSDGSSSGLAWRSVPLRQGRRPCWILVRCHEPVSVSPVSVLLVSGSPVSGSPASWSPVSGSPASCCRCLGRRCLGRRDPCRRYLCRRCLYRRCLYRRYRIAGIWVAGANWIRWRKHLIFTTMAVSTSTSPGSGTRS